MPGRAAYAQPAVGLKMKATTGLRIARGAADAVLRGEMCTRGAAASVIPVARPEMNSMTGPRIVRSADDAHLSDKMRIDGVLVNALPAARLETSSTTGLRIAKSVRSAESSGGMLTKYREGHAPSAEGPDLHLRSTLAKSYVIRLQCSAARRPTAAGSLGSYALAVNSQQWWTASQDRNST